MKLSVGSILSKTLIPIVVQTENGASIFNKLFRPDWPMEEIG